MAGGAAPAADAGGGGRKNVFGEDHDLGVDLNLTALMDILSNLLFFLLASFGATVVMSINASVPVQSAEKNEVADQKESVTATVKLGREGFEVTLVGSAQAPEELASYRKVIPVKADGQDYEGLAHHLQMVKRKYPKSETLILTPEPGVPYELMVKTMDATRQWEAEDNGVKQTLRLFPSVVVSTVVK